MSWTELWGVPITMAWRAPGMRIEQTASRNGG